MGTTGPKVSQGSIGGAASDAGAEYRRGVAAYAAACGLAGTPLKGLAIADVDALVESIALETDEAVDDIRIAFSSGFVADVQAKRSLRKGASLESAIAQWVVAGQVGVDPARQRLVIASANLTGSMRQLREGLNRRRLPVRATPAKREMDILRDVEAMLHPLTAEQRERVLQAAVIWEICVEEPEQSGAREASMLLGISGISAPRGTQGSAWTHLCATAGRLARRRAGFSVSDWLQDLRGAGLTVDSATASPAGDFERRRQAVERYAERLRREGQHLDLRPLGAQLPPLSLRRADARVQVQTDSGTRSSTRDLLWGLMRRHRVVLTGLPGSGKSTMIRQVASQLAGHLLKATRGDGEAHLGCPFPVLTSLKEVNALGDADSFRDRLLRVAIRDSSAADRDLLHEEIERRLDNGLPIVCLMDALDETYEDRAKVVGHVERFLSEVPEGVSALIATRDVAYGHAATLRWAELRLAPPSELSSVIESVLEAAAKQAKVGEDRAAEWVRTRQQWVEDVLDEDTALVETPLIPVLLALLAAERSPGRLPARRADVLKAVVGDVMSRHEVPRQEGRGLASLTADSLETAMMHSYAAAATTILDNTGVAAVEQIEEAVAAILVRQWGLPPGAAQAAARGALRFLDETGIFVVSAPDHTVAARVSLFAEVGDAMYAIQHSEVMPAWVSRRLHGGQLEPLVLAATLEPAVARAWQQAVVAEDLEPTVMRALVRAKAEGAVLEDATVMSLRRALIASVERGTREGWADWPLLMSIGLPAELVPLAVTAASRHSPAHALAAKASIELEEELTNPGAAHDDLLLQLLTIRDLPKSPSEGSGGSGWSDFAIDEVLAGLQLPAAEVLLTRQAPEAVAAVSALAADCPTGLSEALIELLRRTGHQDHATAVNDAISRRWKSSEISRWLNDDSLTNRYIDFLHLVADAQHSRLSTVEELTLSELSDFLQTLGLNESGVRVLYQQSDPFLVELIELTCHLFQFDRGVLATQAQILLHRLEIDGPFEPYFSLFDTAQTRSETDWSKVSDIPEAVGLVVGLFVLSVSQARLAARCLWRASLAGPHAAPMLRDLLPRLDRHPEHQEMVAGTLASLPNVAEPDVWAEHPNPVLRGVAARFAVPVRDGDITERLNAFLSDSDAHVVERAIDNLITTTLPKGDTILETITTPFPGWQCRRCLTQNPAGLTHCANRDCGFGGPDPAGKMQKLLDKRRGADRWL